MPRPKVSRRTQNNVEKNIKSDSWKINFIIFILVIQTGVLIVAKYRSITSIISGDFKVTKLYRQVEFSTDPLDTLKAEGGNFISNFVRIKSDKSLKSESMADYEKTIERKVRVSVLNGCGVAGLAGRWENHLKKGNYDVLEIGDYKRRISQSLIISRVKDMSYARSLAKKIGISPKNVILQISKNIVGIDVTLVLGRDHTMLNNKLGKKN
ncbi:MAG: hypothetical protein CR982_04435 [Candidatus Cloacimonadota bacterium]|nr:MAG: hypothetical protein CR982_04435 [Candidatus Cloacimonadota bacterium]PIE79480.1 MAG: hypothetical protein CSA15_02985 [Candidatus Delongbacteria bacterium]